MGSEFRLRGVNHLALVCSDMAATVEFYRDVLGLPLIKTLELPNGMGQHFFFDIGNGDALAFFWFPEAPEAAPGVSAPRTLPAGGDLVSAIGSMNHVAFDVHPDRIDDYLVKLRAKGIQAADILNHDDSETGVSREVHEGTFVRFSSSSRPGSGPWVGREISDMHRHAPGVGRSSIPFRGGSRCTYR